MVYTHIKCEKAQDGAVAVLSLIRPERLNALALQTLDELHDFFRKLADDDKARVLIIRGEGRAFCAGADLRDEAMEQYADRINAGPDMHLVKVQKRFSRLITEMRAATQPIICLVRGHAAGGGMSMAMAADVCLCAPDAVFIPSFINIGLSGGELGSSWLLQRLVGKAKAGEILLTGRGVGAEEAGRIGLVARVIEDDLLEAGMEIAGAMLAKSPLGLRLTKEALDLAAEAPSLNMAINMEDRTQSILCYSKQFAEMAAAALAKKR